MDTRTISTLGIRVYSCTFVVNFFLLLHFSRNQILLTIFVPRAFHPIAQMRTMVILALVFFVLFYSCPAGLVLYWTTSNVLQFVHQKMAHGRAAA